METLGGLPIGLFADQQAWEQWLDTNQEWAQGIWVKVAKKDSMITTVSYAEALDRLFAMGGSMDKKSPMTMTCGCKNSRPGGPRVDGLG